ncbi:hypothetical protein KM043_010890 [Ampulex compressa]|nr:hypothetical protein KM043_010890 [Ampulex compressa]
MIIGTVVVIPSPRVCGDARRNGHGSPTGGVWLSHFRNVFPVYLVRQPPTWSEITCPGVGTASGWAGGASGPGDGEEETERGRETERGHSGKRWAHACPIRHSRREQGGIGGYSRSPDRGRPIAAA